MKTKVKKKRKKKQFNLNGYIFGALRKIWRWHPERKKALILAQVYGSAYEVLSKGDIFSCAKCDNLFSRNKVHVDHISSVIDPTKGFQTWDIYIKRLFVTSDKLAILCKDCHQLKTQEENNKRRG